MRRWSPFTYSLLAHGTGIGLFILTPILWQSPPPPRVDAFRVLLYNPPPPLPPPLPKGSALVTRPEPARPVTPDVKPEKPRLTPPDDQPKEQKLKPEAKVPEQDQPGDEHGSEGGIPEGMEGGVLGGQVGGVPNGSLGGVIGGTGDVVLDVDEQPRLIRQVKPVYPKDAFTKKIEGVVEVEFVIDADGRVRRARVTRSVAPLDAAALQAVLQWVFVPALKHGKPVAILARAPVAFRIY